MITTLDLQFLTARYASFTGHIAIITPRRVCGGRVKRENLVGQQENVKADVSASFF